MRQSVFQAKPAVPGTGLLVSLFTLMLSACGAGALEEAPPPGHEPASSQSALTSARIRLMAANTTSGNYQSYDPGHGTRIFQGTRPDVVMIQEFNYGDNSPAALRQFVDTAFGTDFSYYRETGAQIPNGVVSRYPILAAGEWKDPYVSNRDFAWARIDVPGPKDLWVVSVHLLSSSATTRNSEGASLVQYIQANIPAGDYFALGGDFNTGSRGEAVFTTLSPVVSISGPYPVDQNGNSNTNASRAKPYDHVLVDGDLLAYQTATIIGASSYPSGLVVDTRVYSPLSEIAPAQYSDSGAYNMQHMAVIKDFLIPGDSGSVTVSSPNGGERWEIGSSQSITWSSSRVANVKLEYTLDGSTWSVITASTPASTGSYPFTAPGPVSSTAKVRVSDAADPSVVDESDAVFTISGTPRVFINELLANEPGSDVTREFVELLNTGTAAADLSGWTVSDAIGVRHTFASGTLLAPGASLVVFGSAAGIPVGVANAVGASTNTLGLNNTTDTVTLKDAAGNAVDGTTYASSLASTDGVSMNRGPDGSNSGAFVLHTTLSALSASPGTRVDGAAFP